MARQLTRLPAGNQVEVVAAARREHLTAAEVHGVVDLIVACASRPQVEFILEQPRRALRQAQIESLAGLGPAIERRGEPGVAAIGRPAGRTGADGELAAAPGPGRPGALRPGRVVAELPAADAGRPDRGRTDRGPVDGDRPAMSDRAIENEVIRRWQERTPMRRIAAEVADFALPGEADHPGSPERDGLKGATHPDLPTPPESRGSILDQHVPFIQDLLTRWPSMTAVRIHEELRGRGFTGKYTIVKDLVRRLRPRAAPPAGAAIRDRPRGSKPKWTTPPTRSTSPRRAGGGSTCSATSWATRGGSTCTSPSRRTSRPRSASTCGPSSTWAALPPPACTTT